MNSPSGYYLLRTAGRIFVKQKLGDREREPEKNEPQHDIAAGEFDWDVGEKLPPGTILRTAGRIFMKLKRGDRERQLEKNEPSMI